jgi:hypothetical protein
MNTNARAILFRIGGLGDVVVALPSISVARRSLPGFSLALVGRAEYGGLLKHSGVVDEVMSFEDARLAMVFSGTSDASSGATNEAGPGAELLKEYSLALGWLNRRGDWPADDWWAQQGIGRTLFTSYESGAGMPMSRFFFDRTRDFLKTSGMRTHVAGGGSGARVVGTPAAIREVPAGAVVVSAFDSAAPNTDKLFDECARLALPGDLRKKALHDLCLRELGKKERRLVVHPGSGGRGKRWPLANFIEVIRVVASIGLEGVLVTGEAEADLEAALEELTLPAGWARASRVPAETLAGLLAESTHYLGNDSGPTHLAAACGASVIALFREDNLPIWRPFGRTRVVAGPSAAGIPVGAVMAALEDLLVAW